MNKQPFLQPILFIDLKKNRIRIHKQTLHLLGDPEYIQLLINPVTRLIAVRRSIQKDYLAHRVRHNNNSDRFCFELYSQELIHTLQKVNDDLESNKGYRIYGKFNAKECIAQFAIDDLVLLTEIQEE